MTKPLKLILILKNTVKQECDVHYVHGNWDLSSLDIVNLICVLYRIDDWRNIRKNNII